MNGETGRRMIGCALMLDAGWQSNCACMMLVMGLTAAVEAMRYTVRDSTLSIAGILDVRETCTRSCAVEDLADTWHATLL